MFLKRGVVSDCIVANACNADTTDNSFECQRNFDQVQGLHDVFLINSREYLFTGSRDMGCNLLLTDSNETYSVYKA